MNRVIFVDIFVSLTYFTQNENERKFGCDSQTSYNLEQFLSLECVVSGWVMNQLGGGADSSGSMLIQQVGELLNHPCLILRCAESSS